MFDAALEGWRNQQAARGLERSTIQQREWLVRRVRDELGLWPWGWTAAAVCG
jgi:integrase/recombinase XerC